MSTVFIWLALSASADPAAQSAGYLTEVKPLLKARCYACHGALKQESGLRLDTVQSILAGGDSGPAAVPKDPTAGELIARITAKDDSIRMPPEGHPLTKAEVALVVAWIKAGAPIPKSEEPDRDPRDHWAFRVPQKADVPDSNANPIDAFLAAEHRRLGLIPVGRVQKSLLLRRLYLDLIGLPPTREQLSAFLNDTSTTAYENVVSRLLDSPHYGERWGRHWMDIWRYTDWYGLGKQLRNSQKHIWHWRDWIVESLNEDKGYDRMIVEMLAADEIAPTDQQTLRATGFLARNYYLFNRTTWLDSTIEHTSKAFLGLTVNCAKCHDHKYDPISQLDYYRMRAIFEPHQIRLDSVPGELDLEKDGLPRAFDAHPDAPTWLHIRGDEKNPDKDNPIAPGAPEFLSDDAFDPSVVQLPTESHVPTLRPFVLDDLLADAEKQIAAARQAVTSSQKKLAEAEAKQPKSALPRSKAEKKPSTSTKRDTVLSDSFDAPRPDIWEKLEGDWSYKDGHVVQKQAGATRRFLRSKAGHPVDFEATLRFRTSGGDKWKSVGISFDVSADHHKMVYMSAVQPGSKLQYSLGNGSQNQYPQNAAVARPVETGRWYDLRIAVRGSLLNVSIDGEHSLAYRMSAKRAPGRFDLVAFDAAVEFDSFEVTTLPAEVRLIEATEGKASKQLSLAALRAQLQAAQAALATTNLRPAQLRSALTAQTSKQTNPESDDTKSLVAAAALASRRYEYAQAEQTLAQAEFTLASAGSEADRKKAQAEIDKTRKARDAAQQKIDAPGESYVSLRASLKALEGPAETDAQRKLPYAKTSTGRRTAFARWIVDPQNPLTARVAVNHIWLRHFGQPLVESVTDFGLRAKKPPQQNLLDWLAVDLMQNGWSMKQLHRLIVTSHAYRRSTESAPASEQTRQADASNHFYWRRMPIRMESQVVRDSVLHLAGRLDLTLGGPTVSPTDSKVRRRSLYFTRDRDHKNPFMTMFDDADILKCYRRTESIVPQQALAMANSRETLSVSKVLGPQLGEKVDREQFVRRAFETILARQPTGSELDECLKTADEITEVLGESTDVRSRVETAIVHALFNHNDFVTIR